MKKIGPNQILKSYGKQRDLEKLVESLNDKIQNLETQPIGGKGFTTSSAHIFQVHLET